MNYPDGLNDHKGSHQREAGRSEFQTMCSHGRGGSREVGPVIMDTGDL